MNAHRLWARVNSLSYAWAILKTHTIYRFAFGSIGAGTVVWSPMMLRNTHLVQLGRHVSIQPGARFDIVTERYGFTFQPRVIIGDGSTFEQNFHLACAQEIVIGQKVAVTENVGIFDIWHPYQDIARPIVDQPLKSAPVRIGDGSLIGMGAVIQPGVTIGRHCVIGANSVVTHNIPDFCVAVGVPAQVIRQYDTAAGQWISI